MVTAGPTCERISNESTNSAMIRKIRHGSSLMKVSFFWLSMPEHKVEMPVEKYFSIFTEHGKSSAENRTEQNVQFLLLSGDCRFSANLSLINSRGRSARLVDPTPGSSEKRKVSMRLDRSKVGFSSASNNSHSADCFGFKLPRQRQYFMRSSPLRVTRPKCSSWNCPLGSLQLA